MNGAWLDDPRCQTDGLNRQPGFGIRRTEWWCRYGALRRDTVNRFEDLQIGCEGLRITTVINDTEFGPCMHRRKDERECHTPQPPTV